MFRSIDLPVDETRASIVISVDGREIAAREGQTLASALLAADVVHFRRTPVSGKPRAPLCLMGVCFDCLVHVDGASNVQSCLVEVRAGMNVCLPSGAPSVEERA